MMQRSYLFILLLVLYGCAGLIDPLHGKPPADETQVQTALREAHAAVDEANAALFALNKTISSNIKAGVWDKYQAQTYLDQSIEYGDKVDRARELLKLGDVTNSKQQAEAIKALIIQLHKQVATQAGKETKCPQLSSPLALQS